MKIWFFILSFSFLFAQSLSGYGLPFVGEGLTNFLDGGPVRPSPGWYWLQYQEYYHSNKFFDARGKLLGGIPSPKFNMFDALTEIVYEFEPKSILWAHPGIDVAIPYVLYSKIQRNKIDMLDSGSGFGDLYTGFYLQWDALHYKGRPFFVHRLEFAVTWPTGKFVPKINVLSPGFNILYSTLYWAGTIFLTPKLAPSWRIQYLFDGKDRKTELRPGDAIIVNYSLAYEFFKGFYAGINGYFVKQIQNNKLKGIEVPHSKEQVFAIGPGALYFFSEEFILFGHLYFESFARNRTQGIDFVVRFVKQF